MRVWDSRTGSKTMKLRGHTDNIRALLLDSTGRFVEWVCIIFILVLWAFFYMVKQFFGGGGVVRFFCMLRQCNRIEIWGWG